MTQIQHPELLDKTHYVAALLEKIADSLRHAYVDTETLQSHEDSLRELARVLEMIRDTEVFIQKTV
jgi:uncharacterized protein YbcC (UPF0753/DUF2309 family)